jgi:hypothetical protein
MLDQAEKKQNPEPIITRSSLSKTKTAEREKAEQTQLSHPPSLPRRKGEVRKVREMQQLLLHPLQKLKTLKKKIGDIIISKKKFLLSSQKVGVSRFEALLGVAGPDK